MEQLKRKIVTNPVRCPAPGHCECLFHWLDPENDAPTSIFCMGVRTDNLFPGKRKSIRNEASDVIVNCILLGSHSSDHGPMTTLTNGDDHMLHILTQFSALSRIGQLKPVLHRALTLLSYLDERAYNEIGELAQDIFVDKKIVTISEGKIMHVVKCSCDELFRYKEDTHEFTDEERKFINIHINLGHTVVKRRSTFNGRSWDINAMEVLNPHADGADYWGPEEYVPYRIQGKCGRCENKGTLFKHHRYIYGSDCDPRNEGGKARPEDLETVYLCWDCDHDVMNGGDIDEDSSEVLQDRAERDYEEDPINNDPPPGYRVR